MQSHDGQRLAQIIKEQIDSFEFRKPFIIKGHESLLSNEISYDQEVNDAISQQILDSKSHDFIESLQEFGMAAHYVDVTSKGIHIRHINPLEMCYAEITAVIYGTKHNIIIVDDEYKPKSIDNALEHDKPFPVNVVPSYQRNYASKECMELVDAILFQENKQPKENHPHGWYRKFEKKRF